MYPELFRIPLFGGIPVNTYGLLVMCGFLFGAWIAVRRAKPLGINTDLLLDAAIIAMIFGILGAKLNFVLQYPEEVYGNSPTGRSIFDLSDGGLHPLGVLIGALPYIFWIYRSRKNEKIRLFHWTNYVLIALTVILTVGGARGVYIYLNPGEYNFDVYKSWQSGFVLYGGLIAAVPAAILYIRMRGEKVAPLADISAPSLALGIAFGRLGCFLNGCCFGKVTESLPWGVRYPKFVLEDRKTPAWDLHEHLPHEQIKDCGDHALPVHPTQLYEFLAMIGLFFFLSWMWKRSKDNPSGRVFLMLCICYAGWRFILEALRGDPGRDLASIGITYSQLISVLVFIGCGIWFFLLGRQKPAPAGDAPPPPEEKESATDAPPENPSTD